jgi:hypothetical protein
VEIPGLRNSWVQGHSQFEIRSENQDRGLQLSVRLACLLGIMYDNASSSVYNRGPLLLLLLILLPPPPQRTSSADRKKKVGILAFPKPVLPFVAPSIPICQRRGFWIGWAAHKMDGVSYEGNASPSSKDSDFGPPLPSTKPETVRKLETRHKAWLKFNLLVH